ncbi:MAG TPA: hypothetical protein VG164_11550 [Trebonia sp.]|jgi:hypothetical protein|nr:hypothetical protein [Trebonia sp.]
MPTETALDWVSSTDFAATPTPADLREFFGIPPSPPEKLDDNIREKRKYWKKKQQKARSDEALKFAGAVLQAVADAEDALKRGAAATGAGDAGFQPGARDREPVTVEDVWRELERLLFRGRYHDALERLQRYGERWGQYPNFIDMRSEVILEAAQQVPGIRFADGVLDSAAAGTRWVIEKLGPTEARYLTLVDLLEAAGHADQIPAVFAEAERQLPARSASFRVRELAVRFRKEAWEPLLRYCVSLVRESGDDRALRSELVQMIIGRVTAELLPLTTEQAVQRYQLVVATAAWIADGVPEAEDFVRVHRMWASNADQPVFGGNWQWRAFFGLITLFIALPLINSQLAKPAWQVLLTGPALGEQQKRKAAIASQNRSWTLVTRNSYIEPVHEQAKLPWQQRPGQWPEIDFSKLFNF